MIGFIYIMSDSAKISLHTGFCTDINKCIAFYKKMPTIATNEPYLLRLVYIERHQEKESAFARFQEVSKMTRKQIEDVIQEYNPDYIEFKPGINIEL